ncbi:MAG TPA: 23S rRNA (uracil(1939)-C(5))-methyltransferase RlmD, partial [Candidatus Acidoferrum sp.]|nr:23S rRNA (uracil(1939)-C(5))-methyltransferase RlmD [Candidatus Acidoferrum sp.]
RQLHFKRKQVSDCIERIGGLECVKVEEPVGSLEIFNYRNKMEFSFHVDPDDGFTLGLHSRGRFDDIFDLQRCYLQSETSNRIIAWIRDFVKRENIPVYDVKFHHGFMRFVVIRQAKRTNQLMVNLVTNYGEFPDRQKLVRDMRQAFPEISTIIHNQNGQKSNIAVGEREQILYGTGYIEEILFQSRFRIRANSFFQTNTLQTESLYRTGFELLQPKKSDTLLDLYCGGGSITILIAPFVTRAVGVELVGAAIRAARENAALNEISNVEFIESDTTDFLRNAYTPESKFDIIVVDPPRVGLHPKTLKRLIEIQPEKLLYISCNPATFARDVKELVTAGYELPRVVPVDMFPHTMHIEIVGLLTRR